MLTDRIFVISLGISLIVHLVMFIGLPGIRRHVQLRRRNILIEVTYLNQVPEETKINGARKAPVVPLKSPPPPEKELPKSPPVKIKDISLSVAQEKKKDIDTKNIQVVKLKKSVIKPKPDEDEKTHVVDLSKLSTSDEFVDYYEAIRTQIKNVVVYPAEARSRGIEGVARLCFCITKTGELVEVHLVASALNYYLDQAALRGIKEASPFPPFPEELSLKFNRLSFNTEISFQLN